MKSLTNFDASLIKAGQGITKLLLFEENKLLTTLGKHFQNYQNNISIYILFILIMHISLGL